jgi:hypothetical protein
VGEACVGHLPLVESGTIKPVVAEDQALHAGQLAQAGPCGIGDQVALPVKRIEPGQAAEWCQASVGEPVTQKVRSRKLGTLGK